MVVLGRIVAPFGVQGWVRVHPFADDPLAWAALPRWWLSSDADASPECWREVSLSQARAHGDGLVALIEGATSRNAAEALDGLYVGAPRAALPTPAEGEFYWTDLIGLDVTNERGVRLGRIAGLIETGANHVLRVQDDGGEHLLPFVASVIKSVDVSGGCMVVAWEADW